MTRALLIVLAACASTPLAPLDDGFDTAAGVSNVTSLSLRQDGVVVREGYFGGTDATTPHDVRSVTKTVMSLLVGAAIDRGCLTSLDQTLGELLGAQAPVEPEKAAITLRDVLSMTSGFAWQEIGAVGYNAWAAAPDQVEYVLSRPLAATPGTVFNYNSGALHLVSVIVTRACAPTAEFAAQVLLGPLGIASRPWETDNQGVTNGAAGLQLSTPDMAAIGEVIRAHGASSGAQLVPAAYVELATSGLISTGARDESYGLGIWIEPPSDAPVVLAEGYGGQFIVVVPAARAVIVATTRWEGLGAQATRDFDQLLDAIMTKLVPAL